MFKPSLIILFVSILISIQAPLLAMECQSDRVRLQMLGTGGPELLENPRASTGYLLWLDNKARIIVDAGPGSAQRFRQSGAHFEDISTILFTHFHVDHSADLSTYIKGGFFTERNTDLPVYGPSGDTFILSSKDFVKRQFSASEGLYPYLANFIDPESQSSYKLIAHTIPWSYKNLDTRQAYKDKDFSITGAPVHHGPFPAIAYRIEVAGCVISFSGDMSGRLNTLPDLAKGSDILVAHNAIPEDAVGVPQLLHMKPSYIGKAAAQAQVRKLLLTHLMERSIKRKDETLKLIRNNYQGPVIFPQDLDSFHP
jgi:ribonuclease BN (tRNA processing enzyme)